MQKKTTAGLIVIVAIVATVIFAGCVEEETPTPTETPTFTPLAPTPTPEATSNETSPSSTISNKSTPSTYDEPVSELITKSGTGTIKKNIYPSYVEVGQPIHFVMTIENTWNLPIRVCSRVVYVKERTESETTHFFYDFHGRSIILDVGEVDTFDFDYSPPELAKGKCNFNIQACKYYSMGGTLPGEPVQKHVSKLDEMEITIQVGR